MKSLKLIYYKGEEPMAKNITVVDEFGNNYGETYLKRAKQLVKKGRAHFIEDAKISLVCPPDNWEDITMSEDKKITQAYILDKIEQIMNNTDYIEKALEEITNISDETGPHSAKADAIASIVSSREETNQQLIKMLNGMYYSLDFNDVKKQTSMKLLEYADDPEAFQNVKEALELMK